LFFGELFQKLNNFPLTWKEDGEAHTPLVTGDEQILVESVMNIGSHGKQWQLIHGLAV
jgi:hypothetical protein